MGNIIQSYATEKVTPAMSPACGSLDSKYCAHQTTVEDVEHETRSRSTSTLSMPEVPHNSPVDAKSLYGKHKIDLESQDMHSLIEICQKELDSGWNEHHDEYCTFASYLMDVYTVEELEKCFYALMLCSCCDRHQICKMFAPEDLNDPDYNEIAAYEIELACWNNMRLYGPYLGNRHLKNQSTGDGKECTCSCRFYCRAISSCLSYHIHTSDNHVFVNEM